MQERIIDNESVIIALATRQALFNSLKTRITLWLGSFLLSQVGNMVCISANFIATGTGFHEKRADLCATQIRFWLLVFFPMSKHAV